MAHLKKIIAVETRRSISSISNLIFWSRQGNKLEPWHIVYIMQH